jgi:uncharacterized membrane protein YqjE
MSNPFFNNSRETGFIDSLRTLAGSVLDLLHIRIELFSVEWQEEQERGKHLLVLVIAGALLLMLGMLLLTFFIVVLFWDSYRLSAIATMTVLYLGTGLFCLWKVRSKLSNRPPPFASSLGEFIEDLKQLRAHDSETSQQATDETSDSTDPTTLIATSMLPADSVNHAAVTRKELRDE